MEYNINPTAFSAVFTVPAEVVDRHIKLAKGDHLKVLLYIMKNIGVKIDANNISLQTDVSLFDVNEALLYWADAGILMPEDGEITVKTVIEKTVKKSQKPDRMDVARRGSEDNKIRYLLQETQMRFGRNLKTNETSTLVWLYDDQGLDVSIILMIVQYAVKKDKANMRFIESTAVDWINRGINTITDADEELRKMAMGDKAWEIVSSAFGLERRKPSKKEKELSLLWIDEWKFSKEMILAAYEACIDSKSKFSIPYIAKILENWHSKGYKKTEEIKQDTNKQEATDYAAYDLDLFEKMLNSK